MEVISLESLYKNNDNTNSYFTDVILANFLISITIHQTHYKKSDWSRAFNQFTIASELDMINAISAADIAFTSIPKW